jgi:hypothetical protein
MPTTSHIGPFTRISYFGRNGFQELSLDITTFKMRRAQEIDRQRYWNERWDSIKDGVATALSRGEWLIALRYNVPGDIHNVDNHTTLFSLAPGCTRPAELACDDHRVLADRSQNFFNTAADRVREDDRKALELFPTFA